MSGAWWKIRKKSSALLWYYRDAIADHPLNHHLDLLVLLFRIDVGLKTADIQRALDQPVGIRARPAGIHESKSISLATVCLPLA